MRAGAVVLLLAAGGAAARESSMQVSAEWIVHAVARSESIDAANLDATILEDAQVPGITVFRCRVRSKQGRRGGWIVGLVSGGKLELDDERTIDAVLAAWHYGKKRTVSAVQVARVVGFLEGTTEPAYPVLTADDIAALADPKWRPHVFLPRETTVDGAPAVEYWNRDGRPPLWRAQLVIKPDGTAELSRKSIGSFL